MELSKDVVRQLAALARLKLTPEETTCYQHDLGAILEHIDRLQRYMADRQVVVDRRVVVDVAELRADIPRVSSTSGESGPTPEEVPTRAELLAGARAVRDGQVVVPGVFEGKR